MQNKFLSTIGWAFRAAVVPVFEAETYKAPVDAYFDQLLAKVRSRLRAGGQARFIATTCNAIANTL